MKTLKKSLSLLLAAVMLLSTFTFVIANAEGSVTVNVQVTMPQVGKKADETIKVDDEKYVPGWPELEEVLLAQAEQLKETEFEAVVKAAVPSWIQMLKNGIAWIEYDKNEIQSLVDAGAFSEETDEAVLKEMIKEYGFAPIGELILCASKEYGLSVTGKDGKEYSTTAKRLEPGDAFKEGKSYICLCVVSQKDKSVDNGDYPDITVNGEKTYYESESYYASYYDFGEAENAPTILDRIIAFFGNILDLINNFINTIKGLFTR